MDVIATQRLNLRPVTEADGPDLVTALDNLDVSRWLSVVPYPYNLTDFGEFQDHFAKAGRTWIIVEAGRFAGVISHDSHLGYWLAPEAQGRGIATEAGRAVLAERFAIDDAPVESGYFASNHRSWNVLRKLGFREVGRYRKFCRALVEDVDHVDLSLTKADFITSLPWEARSDRLTFRALLPVDAGALHDIACHYEVTRQLGPKWPWPADLAFTTTRSRPYIGKGFVWGLFRDGQLIGTVGVTEGEIGYAVHPDHHRQGLASEACRTALAHAFGPMGLTAVAASVWADNQASLGLLSKLGFTVTGHDLGTNACRPDPSPGVQLLLTPEAFIEAANIPREAWRV